MIKKLIYFSIITSMIGSASIIAIDLGFIQLSLFRISIILLLFIMVVKMLLKNKIRIQKYSENTYSIKFMFTWVVYALFSLAWVKDYNAWIKAMFFLIIGFSVFIIYSKFLKNDFDILIAFRLIFIMVIVHNIIGWYEIITNNYMFLDLNRIAIYSRANLPVSTFGNTNDFATFMLFSFWVSYLCLSNTKNSLLKAIYITLLISSSALLFASGSRANLLGLILSMLPFIFLSMRKTRTRIVLMVLLSVVLLMVLFNAEILSNLLNSIDENLTFNFSRIGGSDSVRLNLIINGFIFLVNTFGFGVGAGNIEYWMESQGRYFTDAITNIHNWWAEILVGYGIIIFAMYLIFYLKLFKSFYRKFKYSNNKIDITISLGMMCFMVGYVIASVSSSSNIGSEWLWVFWGIAVAYQGVETDKISLQKNS